MHIPDGFLSPPVWICSWAFSLAGVWFFIKKVSALMQERMVPLMGVASAFIFAAQMINFPVAGGTSGHLLGGVLAAIFLGPWAGALVITIVLIAQALIFQDGGITALGANILNMAVFATVGGYYIYYFLGLLFKGRKGIVFATAVAAWVSVVIASSLCALELALSGTSPLAIVLPAMVGIHAIIGAGEALITTFIVGFIIKVRPDLIYKREGM